MGLTLDDTILEYISLPDFECETQEQILQMGAASAPSNGTIAPAQYIYNDQLHGWQYAQGVIGLSYCQAFSNYDCSQLTSFQKLVQNATSAQDSANWNECFTFR